MTMLDLTRKELEAHKALSPGNNKYLTGLIDAIPFHTVPEKMKAIIAVAQLTSFASQFRRNILLWDGDTRVPINAISFVISGSGNGKDSSVNKARKCFKSGYSLLHNEVERRVIANAIAAAVAGGEDCAEEFSTYKDYLKPIPPIDITPSTGPGLVRHVNDIADLDLTSGFIYSGEFSDELSSNPDMADNIKILSELYDLGVKNATYTKGVEGRTEAINGQPVSALFVGSPGNILYDEVTKKKFNVAFMSKLARRSWFCYVPESIKEPCFMDEEDPVQASLDFVDVLNQAAVASALEYNEYSKTVANNQMKQAGMDITISKKAKRLYDVYQRYNNELADTYHSQESTSTLIRRHLQWKCLKLAGVFAIMDQCNEVEEHHLVDAIKFAETLDDDMSKFEHDLNKSSHERFSDYVRTLPLVEDSVVVSTHDIKKQGFLTSTAKTKLEELTILAAGYDLKGIYTVVNEGSAIKYTPVVKTEVISISFKATDTTELNKALLLGSEEVRRAKYNIASSVADGFTVADTTFPELSELLLGDFAYSPFKFRDGVRGKDNITGGTKWLVFDIDNSAVSAEDTHLMLGDLNHHIALSSDPGNRYKFRLVLELEGAVELSPVAWKIFCRDIADFLAMDADPLPQSQIFFSYSGREVYSRLDARSLGIRDFVMAALSKEDSKVAAHKVSSSQARSLLSDPITTFSYAFEASDGEGSRSMIRAARHAKDLGADMTYTTGLIEDINTYWYSPMEQERLDKILQQIERMY